MGQAGRWRPTWAGALYVIGTAGLSLGIQYAWAKYPQEQQYYGQKGGLNAAAATVDRKGQVSPANHGYVRKVLAADGTFTEIKRIEVGQNAGVTILQVPGKDGYKLPLPYDVDAWVAG